jgi:Flp pilus assembly pilin Flp
MKNNIRKFWLDDSGFILSAELILISTILVLGLIVGLTEIQAAITGELNDVACAIGSLNQSYVYRGFAGCKGVTYGSVYYDSVDACDVCNVSLCSGGTAVSESGGGYGMGGYSAGVGGVSGGGSYSYGGSSKTVVGPQVGTQSNTVVIPTIPDNAPVLTAPTDCPCTTSNSCETIKGAPVMKSPMPSGPVIKTPVMPSAPSMGGQPVTPRNWMPAPDRK